MLPCHRRREILRTTQTPETEALKVTDILLYNKLYLSYCKLYLYQIITKMIRRPPPPSFYGIQCERRSKSVNLVELNQKNSHHHQFLIDYVLFQYAMSSVVLWWIRLLFLLTDKTCHELFSSAEILLCSTGIFQRIITILILCRLTRFLF